MVESQTDKRHVVALVGNPNSGKSSLFNLLTGQSQPVGNYAGVTVDKKKTTATIEGVQMDIVDYPGLYSLYPNSSDEKLVVDALLNSDSQKLPDLVVYVADASNLERHMLLATQIIDLHIPMIFVVNMIDLTQDGELDIDYNNLHNYLQVPVISISCRTEENIEDLKKELAGYSLKDVSRYTREDMILPVQKQLPEVREIDEALGLDNYYKAKVYAHHHSWLQNVEQKQKDTIGSILEGTAFSDLKYQIDETMARYQGFESVIRSSVKDSKAYDRTLTDRIDDVVTHRIWGSFIFFGILFFIFQAIFAWSALPMEWIEEGFAGLGDVVSKYVPEGWVRDLLVDGVIAGLGGVLVFIPQIAILFFLISVLEETGYMARVVFMFDDVMQKFGLNGRSIVSLVSSSACAIPAIMSARTISNWKERLTTILVSPLISCNARIPVYTVLVGFAVAPGSVYGFNRQGLAFMGLYLLGIAATLITAIVLKYTLKTEGSGSMLMMEMPQYKSVHWGRVLRTVWEKVRVFVVEAGKIILIISMLLWVLASYGPSGAMERAEQYVTQLESNGTLSEEELANIEASKKLEASYAGHIGKWIEPAIKPLGFDWKIGIALITSFAAREVFVGTMATIYSIGNTDDERTVRERMAVEMDASGRPVYDAATSWSLLVFYVFALQCLSTLAVTRRETGSWKWPIIQFLYMGGLAYFGSLLVYTMLS